MTGLIAVVVLFTLGVSGCASQDSLATGEPNRDPLEPLNRITFRINNTADRYILRPIAVGYEKITPRPIRIGVSNFFSNLKSPIIIINDVLQGKFIQASRDTTRFIANSTIGVGGLLDPASDVGLGPHDEDLGQTFAAWGIPSGPYLIIPLFGPYTFREAVGTVGDSFAHPLVFMDDSGLKSKLRGLYLIQKRAGLLRVDEQIDNSFDPYVFVRDAYFQQREFLIHDGRPPEDDLLPEDGFDDDFEEEDL